MENSGNIHATAALTLGKELSVSPADWRLDGILSWCYGLQGNLVPLLENEPIFLGFSARILVITPAKRSLHSGK
jgi:hypothetical protein